MKTTRTPSADDPILERNQRADRIAEQDPAAVYEAATGPGLDALSVCCDLARATPEVHGELNGLVSLVWSLAFRPGGRTPGDTLGWSVSPNAPGERISSVGFLPAAEAPTEPERADALVVRLARRIPAGGGLSALTVIVEAAGLHVTALESRYVITLGGGNRPLNRAPAMMDLATLSPVEAVMVDGEPMVSGGPEALTTWRRVRPKAGEQRAFAFAGPRSLDDQAVGDVVIRTLASLPRMDMRSPIVGDVARTAALAFALTGYGPIPDSAGAVFVGGRDTLPNRQRWWKACEWLRAMTITINERTGEWVGLANVDPDGAGGVHLGPPAWWRGKGRTGHWRLSGALWRSVRIGGGRGAGGQDEHYSGLARMLAGFEARLCYSPSAGRGKDGRVANALRPVRKGGPGPDVLIGWRDALTLSGENVPADATARGERAAHERYRKRVETLIAAGYQVGPLGEAAPAGDTVEIVRVQRGAWKRPAGLLVRASARFCAAAVAVASGRQTWERISAGRLLGSP